MGGSIIIAIILFVIALVGLVVILRTHAKRSRSTSAAGPKTELKEATAYRPEIPVKKASEAPKHNTVYTYIAPQPTICCPYCDGENPPYSQTCCICGNSLNR